MEAGQTFPPPSPAVFEVPFSPPFPWCGLDWLRFSLGVNHLSHRSWFFKSCHFKPPLFSSRISNGLPLSLLKGLWMTAAVFLPHFSMSSLAGTFIEPLLNLTTLTTLCSKNLLVPVSASIFPESFLHLLYNPAQASPVLRLCTSFKNNYVWLIGRSPPPHFRLLVCRKKSDCPHFPYFLHLPSFLRSPLVTAQNCGFFFPPNPLPLPFPFLLTSRFCSSLRLLALV